MILKQENKVVKNLSGEILTEPPIIDLDYRYGVTKDGSNLVSKWKDQNRPFSFIQPNASNQPTENGDGVDFEYNTLKELIGKVDNNIYQSFYIYWECKIPTMGSYDVIFNADGSGVRGYGFGYQGTRIAVFRNGNQKNFINDGADRSQKHSVLIKSYDGLNCTLWVNGNEIGSVLLGGQLNGNGNKQNVGGYFFSSSSFSFGGTIYNLKFGKL